MNRFWLLAQVLPAYLYGSQGTAIKCPCNQGGVRSSDPALYNHAFLQDQSGDGQSETRVLNNSDLLNPDEPNGSTSPAKLRGGDRMPAPGNSRKQSRSAPPAFAEGVYPSSAPASFLNSTDIDTTQSCALDFSVCGPPGSYTTAKAMAQHYASQVESGRESECGCRQFMVNMVCEFLGQQQESNKDMWVLDRPETGWLKLAVSLDLCRNAYVLCRTNTSWPTGPDQPTDPSDPDGGEPGLPTPCGPTFPGDTPGPGCNNAHPLYPHYDLVHHDPESGTYRPMPLLGPGQPRPLGYPETTNGNPLNMMGADWNQYLPTLVGPNRSYVTQSHGPIMSRELIQATTLHSGPDGYRPSPYVSGPGYSDFLGSPLPQAGWPGPYGGMQAHYQRGGWSDQVPSYASSFIQPKALGGASSVPIHSAGSTLNSPRVRSGQYSPRRQPGGARRLRAEGGPVSGRGALDPSSMLDVTSAEKFWPFTLLGGNGGSSDGNGDNGTSPVSSSTPVIPPPSSGASQTSGSGSIEGSSIGPPSVKASDTDDMSITNATPLTAFEMCRLSAQWMPPRLAIDFGREYRLALDPVEDPLAHYTLLVDIGNIPILQRLLDRSSR